MVIGPATDLLGRRSSRLSWPARAGSVAAGLALSQVLPEPPNRYHPVAWFGSTMERAEQRRYRDDRARGVQHTAIGAALAAATGFAGRLLVGATAMNVVATTVTVGGRMLTSEAVAVGAALDAGDLDEARGRLPALVGRDPSSLSADEVARAVVESVAENSVDAVVAPVLWGAVAGGAGALTYRAINTMDAMVGHHSDRFEQFGWASARLDDLVNWVPARVAAALVALLRPRRAREVWRAVRVDAPRHPSPNAGVVEAAFAAALGLRLGGVNRYGERVEERASLGRGRSPTARDIAAAVRLSHQLAGVMIAGLTIAAAAPSVVRRLKHG
ncbi:MAG: adenosylcobinamide-phosphate synthase CbiB [Ilumatobacteraceae bacterium]